MIMKKKEYTTPKMEVVEIESEDVISASGKPGEGDNPWPSGNSLNTRSSAPTESRTNFYDRYSK